MSCVYVTCVVFDLFAVSYSLALFVLFNQKSPLRFSSFVYGYTLNIMVDRIDNRI